MKARRSRQAPLALRVLPLLVLPWLLAACAFVHPRQGPSPPPPAAAVRDVTLENGLRVVIVPDPLAPVVTTVVNYRVGSDETPPGFPGTAHALEHMMFRGTPNLSADQLATIAATLGGDFDADTQQTVTQYFFTVPATDLDLALRIEADRMRDLLATPALWHQERGAIEQEVAQDLSSPSYIAYTRLLETLYRGTPYAHDALGTRASFQKTTAAALRRFHATWYVPNNAVLVIAGDVQPDDVLASVRELFGPIPAAPLPARAGVRLRPVEARTLSLPTDAPHGSVWMAFRAPGYASPDYAAAEVLADALASQRGPLHDLVVRGEALGADLGLNPLPASGMAVATASFAPGADARRLATRLRAVLAQAAAHGIDPDLVAAARRREIAAAEFQKNSVSDLAMLWSEAIAIEGRDSPAEDVAAIERVTPADVDRVAHQMLDLDHAVVVVLTPRPSGRPVASKGFGGRESFAPTTLQPVVLPDWASRLVEQPQVPGSTLAPVDERLPNGIRLIVQTERVSPTVGVYGHVEIRPSLEEPPGKEGVDAVLSRLFPYGTTSLDRLAFQKALDDIAADQKAGSDFSIEVLRDHFDRAVELLADDELHPALPPEAFAVVQRQVAAARAGLLESPHYRTQRALLHGLFPPDDPTLRETTPTTVRSLTLADVASYHQHVYRPDLTTIVVIGDVTPEEARATILRHFGGWTARGPKPATKLPPVPRNTPTAATVSDPSRVQDTVVLSETLGDLTRSNPDYYPLQLGNHVLGGGFYATRLYRDLRERGGLVYYVASGFDVGLTRGLYEVTYGCDPGNAARARAIVVRELERMQAEPVSEAELTQARAMLVNAIPLDESSVESIADGFLHRVALELPLDEPTRAAATYLRLSAADVRAAWARWLRPGDLVQVIEGPPR